MKIKYEDSEFEEFILSGQGMVAVPFEVTVPLDGEAEICVYAAFSHIAEEFIKRFGGNPLSDEAISFLKDTLGSEIKEYGYSFDEGGEYRLYTFFADESTVITVPAIDAEVVMLSTNEEFERYYNNATRDIELDDGDPDDVCFAVVSDDLILSYAAVNDISDDESLELNTETAVNSRKKGYSTAAVASLVKYLVSRGNKVTYKVRISNIPSVKVAEKAGLVKKADSFSFVCYRSEDIDGEDITDEAFGDVFEE